MKNTSNADTAQLKAAPDYQTPVLANGFHFNRVRPRSNFDKECRQVSLLGVLGEFSSVRVEVSGRNSATVAQVKDLIASAPELLAALRDCANLAANLLDAVRAAKRPIDRATEIRLERARAAIAKATS